MFERNMRQYARWHIDHQASVGVGLEDHCNCQVRDVSLKGLQIILKSSLPKDTTVKLMVALSRDCVLNVDAWVAWHKAQEDLNTYGLYFSRISDGDKEKIYRFLREHFPEAINRNWFPDVAFSSPQGGEVMDDRRIFARFPISLSVKYLDPMRNEEGNATTMDLSAKGVGIVASSALTPNTALEMWLSVPSQKEPFYSRGEVAWTKLVAPNQYQSGINLEKADFMNTGAILRAHKLLR